MEQTLAWRSLRHRSPSIIGQVFLSYCIARQHCLVFRGLHFHARAAHLRYDDCEILSDTPVSKRGRRVHSGRTATKRRSAMSIGARIGLIVISAVALILVLLRLAEFAGHRFRRPATRVHAAVAADRLHAPVQWSDRFGDGTPDFLRLTDPADQAAFRRWFTLIAEYQAVRPRAEIPPEIADCASLLRYAYREALMQHDDGWFVTTGIDVASPPGEIRAWSYPHSALGAALFRIRPGPFEPADISNGAFAQFADAKTLVERNAFFVSRDVRAALPGDLLFYRQFGQSSPWHSMIVMRAGAEAAVVYHTGPDHGRPGEPRRVPLAELVDHPQPQWRPVAANPNFLGVYRWNILRGD